MTSQANNCPHLIPRQILFGNPDKTIARLSPDGRYLAYVEPRNGVLNITVRKTNRQTGTVVTDDKVRGIRMFFWQEDSKHVLYIQDENGDEDWHLYQTNIETRQTRDLTPHKGVTCEPLALDHKHPDEMLIALNLRTSEAHDVYRVNLNNGTLTMDTENPGDVASWGVDNDLNVRTAQVFLPDGGNEIRYRKTKDHPWESLLSWGPEEQLGGIAGFTEDNQNVLLITSIDANTARLIEIDPRSGTTKVLAEDPQYDVAEIITHPSTDKLEAVTIVKEKIKWKFMDAALQNDFRVLKQVNDGDITITSRDRKDRNWIVTFSSDNAPIHYYRYNRRSKQAQFLFSNRKSLEGYKLARMRPISFDAQDGMKLHGYLTLPLGKRHRNLPMVLLVHGGPYGRDVWGLDNEVQWLANRGYAVLQINFRGSTGYGKDYVNAGDREWSGKMHTDLLDGKQWAIEKGYADPDKICIYGGSYGGYAALVGLAFTPDEFCCGVDIVGPSNLVTLLSSIPAYWKPMRSLFDRRVGNVDSEVEFLNSCSPLYRANDIKSPLLIAQGANDPRVKQAESDQIVSAMRENGQEVDYLLFPDEGHGFARPENQMLFYACAEQFLAKHLGGRAEPPTDAEDWSSLSQ